MPREKNPLEEAVADKELAAAYEADVRKRFRRFPLQMQRACKTIRGCGRGFRLCRYYVRNGGTLRGLGFVTVGDAARVFLEKYLENKIGIARKNPPQQATRRSTFYAYAPPLGFSRNYSGKTPSRYAE